MYAASHPLCSGSVARWLPDVCCMMLGRLPDGVLRLRVVLLLCLSKVDENRRAAGVLFALCLAVVVWCFAG